MSDDSSFERSQNCGTAVDCRRRSLITFCLAAVVAYGAPVLFDQNLAWAPGEGEGGEGGGESRGRSGGESGASGVGGPGGTGLSGV